MSAPVWRRVRPWLAKIGLALLAPIVLIAVLELLFIAFDIAPDHAAKHRNEGDHVSARYDPAVLDRELAEPSREPRVVCLGDSTMAGTPFEDQLSMCTMVADGVGGREAVVNLAQPGFDSGHILEAGRIACRHESSLVLVYVGHNEFLNRLRYIAGTPPGLLLRFAKWLRRLRVYRGIAILVAHQPQWVEQMEAEEYDEEVYANYAANVTALLDACKGRHVMLSTVVSNAAFRFPTPGPSLRESRRTSGPPSAVATDGVCRHCFRAGPQVNKTLRRLARRYDVPLVEAERFAGRADKFWDHVHPKPEVHRAMAAEALRLAKARGWIADYREPAVDLAAGDLQRGAVDRALYNVQFDPELAIAQLAALEGPPDPVQIAVGSAIAAFLIDRTDDVAKAFGEAKRLLGEHKGHRARWAACGGVGSDPPLAAGEGKPPCQLECMPWCGKRLVTQGEREELVALARSHGGAAVARVMERF